VALVLDTGPLYAYLDAADGAHSQCKTLIDDTTEQLVVPSPVLVEVDYWIHERMHQGVLLRLLDDLISDSFSVVALLPTDYERVRQLCDRYADADIGFVDASVLAIVERLNEPKLATLDHRDFRIMRPRHVDALTLLPE
jgi:predicted nucleic acid-binding protein